MVSTYSKQSWANGSSGGTPLTATRLQHLEDGLEAVDLAKVDTVSIGVAGGVAELDADGLVPLTRLPDQSVTYAALGTHKDVTLSPLADGRGIIVEAPSWSASRAFSYGANKDGIFYIDGFTDASGSNSPITYTKMFGGTLTKTGPGNVDAHWASINHQGTGEAGLFIGDVTGSAGGNLWGGHFALTANTVEAGMFGLRVDLNNNASGSTVDKRGLNIRSGGTQDATFGILIDTIPGQAGSWGNFITARNPGGTTLFNVDKNGSVTASSASDGAQVLRMAMDRPWAFRQVGTAGSTALRLAPDNDAKTFRITGPNGTVRQLEIIASDTASSAQVKIAPDAGQKIGFFAVSAVAQQTAVGVTAGFTAGAGTAVDSAAKFTGGLGASAYTIGDLVAALKNYGLLAV